MIPAKALATLPEAPAAALRPRLPAAVPYIGGKWRLAPKILDRLPPHAVYVEPFSGAASVLFAKSPALVECLNDLEGAVANFFRVLREPDTRQALLDRLLWTPYSRDLFRELCATDPPGDPVAAAWRFYTLARQSYGGYRPGQACAAAAGRTRSRWRRDMFPRSASSGASARMANHLDALDALGARLRSVYIESQDFAQVVERWDSPRTLFYADPPYMDCEAYYNGFAADDHARLAELLNRVEGRVALSYAPHPALAELYPAPRWRRHVLDGRNTAGVTQQELLITNYARSGARRTDPQAPAQETAP